MAGTIQRAATRPTTVAQHFAGRGGALDALDISRGIDQAIRDRNRWLAWALLQHLRPWGPEAAALQARVDTAARATEARRQRFHASRQIVGKAAVARLQQGAGAEALVAAMRTLNTQLALPLPDAEFHEVLLRAAERVVLAHV